MRSIGREWENDIGRGLLKEIFLKKSFEKIFKNWKINCMREKNCRELKKNFGEEEKENWKKKFKRTKGEEES